MFLKHAFSKKYTTRVLRVKLRVVVFPPWMSKHGSQKTLFPPNNDLQLSFEPPTWLLLLISGHHRSWHPFSDSWNDRSSFYLCLYGSLFWFIAFSVGFLRPVVKSKYLLTKFIFLAHPDHVYCVAWELTVSGIYALSTSSFFFCWTLRTIFSRCVVSSALAAVLVIGWNIHQ